MTPRRLADFRRGVVAASPSVWRDLPWRSTRDPWLVLVSEVMLQQTQAERVVEPYRRFTARYPTPAACAASPAATVVRAWAGLGYNRRAVRLHRAATEITERHAGSVPANLAGLLALPGVGPYTAHAVLAFAFQQPVGAADTNVRRLLARALAGRPLGSAAAQELADCLVPSRGAWRFDQALFDIGAAYCAARPRCAACPLRRRCTWAATGGPDPAAPARRQSRFAGSDRQGRGRLVDALRHAAIDAGALAEAAGWPADPVRARRAADGLVADGIAAWHGGRLALA